MQGLRVCHFAAVCLVRLHCLPTDVLAEETTRNLRGDNFGHLGLIFHALKVVWRVCCDRLQILRLLLVEGGRELMPLLVSWLGCGLILAQAQALHRVTVLVGAVNVLKAYMAGLHGLLEGVGGVAGSERCA